MTFLEKPTQIKLALSSPSLPIPCGVTCYLSNLVNCLPALSDMILFISTCTNELSMLPTRGQFSVGRSFLQSIHLYIFIHPMLKGWLVSFPAYGWGNWGSNKSDRSPKVIEPVSGGMRIKIRDSECACLHRSHKPHVTIQPSKLTCSLSVKYILDFQDWVWKLKEY